MEFQSDSEPEVEQIGDVPEDVPFEIPTKWKWVQLRELVTYAKQKVPDRDFLYIDVSSIHKFAVVSPKRLSVSNAPSRARKIVQSGSVLFSTVRPYLMNVCVIDNVAEETIASTAFATMLCNKSINNKYLFYVLTSPFFTEYVKSVQRGVSYPAISDKDLQKSLIPLPPYNEQLRIVTKVEHLLVQTDKAEKAYNELTDSLTEQYKTLILDKAMRGQLVPQLDSEPYVAQVGETPKGVPFAVPDKWKWSRFKDCMTIERGGSPRPINEYLTADADGINWIKIGDATRGSKYIESCKEKIKPSGLKKTRFIPKGSLILTNSMSFGYPYILGVDGCIHDGWLALSRFEKHLDKEFLYYYLLSPLCRKQFVETASGAVVKNLNTKKVLDLYIPVPPLVEQQRIVVQLELLLNQVNKLSI